MNLSATLRHFAFLCLTIGGLSTAHAHRLSDACLRLTVEAGRLDGRIELPLRDLALAAPLDPDRDGAVTWGEVRAADAAIRTLLHEHLAARADSADVALSFGEVRISDLAGEPAAWVPLSGRIPSGAREIEVRYELLFEIDPGHRGLLSLERNGESSTFVFAPGQTRVTFPLRNAGTPAGSASLLRFIAEGVHHIAIGYDHLLFLLALLLPSVMRPGARGFAPAPSFAPVASGVLRVVTAFTLAHSVTLGLAASGLVQLPTRVVETAIAASVGVAALNNLMPFFRDRGWWVAGGFGLIHGFGFAGVLAELELPRARFATALLGFNLGVELGQLAAVAVFLPVAWLLRSGWVYRRLALQAGSAAILVVALTWVAERALGPS